MSDTATGACAECAFREGEGVCVEAGSRRVSKKRGQEGRREGHGTGRRKSRKEEDGKESSGSGSGSSAAPLLLLFLEDIDMCGARGAV